MTFLMHSVYPSLRRTKKALPMQIDGEPWMQPPCTVNTAQAQKHRLL